MPVDTNGNVSRPATPLPVSGQNADAPQVNTPIDDIYNVLNMLPFLDGRKALRGNLPMGGYRVTGAGDAVDPQDFVTLAQVQSLISAVAGFPVGVPVPYMLSSTTPPAGFVFANGQELLRATYPVLWAAIQAGNNLAATQAAKTNGQFGPGNGATTFTLPNLYADDGYFIRPMASGRTIGSVQADEMKSHTHTGGTTANGNHSHRVLTGSSQGGSNGNLGSLNTDGGYIGFTSESGNHSHTLNIDATGGTETRPKNIAYPVLIKT